MHEASALLFVSVMCGLQSTSEPHGQISIKNQPPIRKEAIVRLHRHDQKSEAFCRRALSVMGQNPQMLPPNIPLAEAQSDLAAIDLLQRITRLQERASDTQHALGSDVLRIALQGYTQLKGSGKTEGLEPMRRELAGRFARGTAAKAKAA